MIRQMLEVQHAERLHLYNQKLKLILRKRKQLIVRKFNSKIGEVILSLFKTKAKTMQQKLANKISARQLMIKTIYSDNKT